MNVLVLILVLNAVALTALPAVRAMQFSNVASTTQAHMFRAYVKDAETEEPLAGANAVIEGTTLGASADDNGYLEIRDIPSGLHRIVFRLIGYEQRTETFVFPVGDDLRAHRNAGPAPSSLERPYTLDREKQFQLLLAHTGKARVPI